MKVWHALEVALDKAAEQAVTPQLWNAGTTGIEVSEDSPQQITLRAYFAAAPEVEKLRAEIVRALGFLGLPETALRQINALTIADQDWLSEWKKGYEPIEVGARLLVTPSWKRAQVAETERHIIQIDPGMAFGTGTHETTRGCLELLEKYWPPQNNEHPALLDVGTGTGILAMAAHKLCPAARVVGFDVDPEAVSVAEENATINGLGDALELEVNKLSFYRGQEFDVVVANLTADVIADLSVELNNVIKGQGTLIVSGILREQSDDVLALLARCSFDLLESRPDGEWVTFALRSQKTLRL
jgi:ribosomal protein L11 methyltransferase